MKDWNKWSVKRMSDKKVVYEGISHEDAKAFVLAMSEIGIKNLCIMRGSREYHS